MTEFASSAIYTVHHSKPQGCPYCREAQRIANNALESNLRVHERLDSLADRWEAGIVRFEKAIELLIKVAGFTSQKIWEKNILDVIEKLEQEEQRRRFIDRRNSRRRRKLTRAIDAEGGGSDGN